MFCYRFVRIPASCRTPHFCASDDAAHQHGTNISHCWVYSARKKRSFQAPGSRQQSCSRTISHSLEKLARLRSEEHTSELQSLMRISYAVFCLKKNKINININSILLYHNLTVYTINTYYLYLLIDLSVSNYMFN